MNKQKKTVGVIGLGYVGLPLLINFNKFFDVIGFDSNSEKVIKINEGISEINHIPSSDIQNIQSIYPRATSDYSFIEKVDAIIICVPTPITKYREPDLTFVKTVMENIGPFLQKGQLISLESTTYPGTTEEIIYGKLKQLGFEAGLDIFVTYSPEREDPGSKYLLEDIPKVIGGLTPACSKLGVSFYSQVFKQVVEVSSVKVAELSKLLENIHRAVNIGMINEFKIICDSMNIDPFEVIEAAATKPFGFVPYYPGPGWGGHCIPVDPFYLSWKVKEFDQTSRFIELAGELNQITQKWVISKISSSLNEKGVALSKSRILLLGLAYKPNVDDARESPSLYIFSELLKTGARVDYSDPFFKTFPKTRKYNLTSDSVDINATNLASYDAVIMLTNHETFNLPLIHNHAKLIIDTRGVFKPDDRKVIRA